MTNPRRSVRDLVYGRQYNRILRLSFPDNDAPAAQFVVNRPKWGKMGYARIADDTGGGIKLYHMDNFLGSGKAVVKAWLKGGVNGTNRRVKYLGVDE